MSGSLSAIVGSVHGGEQLRFRERAEGKWPESSGAEAVREREMAAPFVGVPDLDSRTERLSLAIYDMGSSLEVRRCGSRGEVLSVVKVNIISGSLRDSHGASKCKGLEVRPCLATSNEGRSDWDWSE